MNTFVCASEYKEKRNVKCESGTNHTLRYCCRVCKKAAKKNHLPRYSHIVILFLILIVIKWIKFITADSTYKISNIVFQYNLLVLISHQYNFESC